MHDVTIYFVGGSSIALQECSDKVASDIGTWLNDDSLKTFRIDIPNFNRTKLIRKDLILFIDIE